ncbi:hypothetical protein LH23_15670 [Cedecea neteri]|uniref:Uncharacterized protein n=1 Tax=Cedecea neteri TaxID=158822 RepID=A0AAN0S6B6_9ENTR|nr:hypothetical protein LH23_15670 [Cedecea neteri]
MNGIPQDTATNTRASGTNSVALGANAIASQANSIAIGATANASQANSVALGNGSVTDVAHTGSFVISGSAAGTANGVVSVGAAGAERQIQNVAPGVLSATSTDAINGSQLFATNNQVNTNTGNIATNTANIATNTANIAGNTTSITNLTNGTVGLVKQDPTTQYVSIAGDKAGNTVNISGTSGNRYLIGVTAGTLSAASTDAVNGSQLFATNNQVSTNTGNIAANTANIAGNTTSINNLTNGTVGLVKQDQTTQAISVAGDKAGTSVSIAGTAGNRTLSGVAPAALNATSTQAVNGSQLFATNNQVSTNTGNIATNTANIAGNTSSINNLTNGTVGLVKQDQTTQAISVAGDKAGTSVSIAGTAGNRTLSGVAPAALNATSTQAVNGSQLFATNNQVSTNTGNIATNTANIAGNTTSINNLTNGTIGLVKQDQTTQAISVAGDKAGTSVSIAGTAGSRTLTGVTAGTLSGTSTDAVNGSQLFATNNQVSTNTGNIATNTANIATNTANIAGNTSAITNLTNGTVGLVKQDQTTQAISVAGDKAGTSVSIAGTAGSRTLTGVTAGTLSGTSTDAVNGSQLFATNNQVTANTGNIATNTANIAGNTASIATNTTNLGHVASSLGGGAGIAPDGSWTAPDYAVQGGNYSNVGAALGALDTATTGNSTAITNLQTQLNEGAVGLVKQDATTREISVAAATDGTSVTFANASGVSRTLSGIADGELSATSNQAVNGSQLFATNNQVTANTASIATNTTNVGHVASSLGGGAGIAPDGSWTAPDYAVQGGNYANVGAALGALDTATTGNSTAITNLQTQLNEGAVGLVKQDATTREISVAAATDGTSVTFANASGVSRTLSGVADGELSATSNQAVNGSQLFATNNQVTANTANIAGNTASIATNTTNLGHVASSLGGGAGIAPDGSWTAPDYAVQGGNYANVGAALGALDTATTGNSTAITNLQAQLNEGAVGLVKQDATTREISVAAATDGTSVTFANASGVSRTLSGVADGELSATSNQAVNGSQLFATNNQVTTNTGNIATNTANIATNTANIAGNTASIATNTTNLGNVASSLGGGAGIAPDGSWTAPDYAVQGGNYSNVGAALGALDTATTGNSTAITNLQTQLNEGAVGLVKQDATTREISVAAATDGTSVTFANASGVSRTLSGVADGELSATSNQAVNGSQLFATNNQVTTNTGNIATNTANIATNTANIAGNTASIATNTTNLGNVASSLGGGAGIAPDGSWTAPDYAVQGGNYSNVGAALGALDTATTGNSTAITNLQTQLNEGAVGLVKQDATTREISVAAATDGTSVTFANASGVSRTLSGVADGELSATSNQAVNGSQLFATNNQVTTNTGNIATNTANIATNTANIAGNTASIATNTTNLGHVASSLGGGAGIAPDGSWTAPDYAVQGGNYANVGAALGALDTATTGNSTAITNLQTQLNEGAVGLVKQDATTREISVAAATDGISVTFANASGVSRTLSGVADGELSATSNQAVNGSQLFATNNQVTANTVSIAGNTASIATNTTNLGHVASSLGGGAGIAPDGSWTAPDYAVQGGNYSNVGAALGALDTATTGNSTAITNLQTQLNEGAVGLVKQDATTREISVAAATDGTSVTFANASGVSRTLSGVADGELSATSNQAVNGSQLFATNARVSTNTTNLGHVATSLGGGAGIAPDGTWTAPDYAVQGGNYANVGDALSALDVATTGNSTAITNLQTEINNGGLGLVKQDATTRDITVAAATDGDLVSFTNSTGNTRTLSGVTAALLSSTSTQAVNGSQLYAANNTIVNILGGSAALDGNGNITGPTWTIQGTTTNNISQALASLDNSVNDLKKEAQSGGGKIVTQPDPKDTVSVGGHTGGTSVSLTGQEGDRKLTGVANGVNDNDAVTVAQLNALSREVVAASKQLAVNVSDSVTPASATGADSIALGGNANSSGTNAISIGNGAAASGSGSSAVGASSSASGTNATAMGQNSNASGANSVALGSSSTASGSNSVALGANSVASRDNSVSVGAAGNERQITNVAAGTQSTDAVNLGQLNSAQQQNNRAFSQLSRRIDRVENKLTAGIASSMAMAGIPQAYQPDSNLVGAAISGYSDKSAIAVGISKISENGRWITKLQASANTESDVGASIGVGYQW